MSGGQQEGNALSEMYDDIRIAARSLSEAINHARAGYRGVGITDGSIMEAANLYLERHGFELCKKDSRV